MLKRTMTAAALVALLAMPAVAQPSASSPPKQEFVQSQAAGDWRGSKLIGAIVYGPDNASIGEIGDVLIGADGKIRAVVVGVGGFLGVTDKDIAVPFQALAIKRGPGEGTIDKITVNYSKDDLRNAPRFVLDRTSGQQTTGAGSQPRENGK